jgi:hypothetical protein
MAILQCRNSRAESICHHQAAGAVFRPASDFGSQSRVWPIGNDPREYGKQNPDSHNRLRSGPLIHIDETEVDLRGRKGYVWVLASMDQVYFFYRDSREGTFLKEMLGGFRGVLVSDFFTAYDSLDCPQQKCLIHLLRDLNEDQLKNPFDEEFKTLAHRFASLLQQVIQTVDRYGLKTWHLHKHRKDVEAFFEETGAAESPSQVAQGYQARFEKYRSKLFTFLEYDGVPWNNNNAEHAIKCFARHRQFADGRFTEASINDYLILLSIYQSCEYQGSNFLDFLRGTGQDRVEGFGSGRRKPSSEGESKSSSQPTGMVIGRDSHLMKSTIEPPLSSTPIPAEFGKFAASAGTGNDES